MWRWLAKAAGNLAMAVAWVWEWLFGPKRD